MFGQLIRRKTSHAPALVPEVALESMICSLTTDIPRPTDSRADERLLATLPVAKVVADEWQDLCRIRNITAGGLMAETASCHEAGVPLLVELNSNQRICGNLVWTRDTIIGIRFDQNIDIREILANRRPRVGFRPRPARLDIQCSATIKIEGLYHKVEVQDISLGGIKVRLRDRESIGKDVLVTVESLRPVKGTIRWHREGMAGIVFQQALTFEEVAEWLGKRIEVASLKASTQPITR